MGKEKKKEYEKMEKKLGGATEVGRDGFWGKEEEEEESEKKKRKRKNGEVQLWWEEMDFGVCFWMDGGDELKMKGPNRFSKNGYKWA